MPPAYRKGRSVHSTQPLTEKNNSDHDEPDEDIEFICLPIPRRNQSRRTGSSGEGSQRTIREVFNRMYADLGAKRYENGADTGPLLPESIRSTATMIRTHLYAKSSNEPKRFSRMGLVRRDSTWSDIHIVHAAGVEYLRKCLEANFEELKMAKNHWAAIGLIKEVLRRDRKRSNNLVQKVTDQQHRSFLRVSTSQRRIKDHNSAVSADQEEESDLVNAVSHRHCSKNKRLLRSNVSDGEDIPPVKRVKNLRSRG